MAKVKWSFPKTLFIHRNEDTRGEEFLDIEESADEFALPKETVLVGEYKLVGVRKVKCEINIK